MSIVKVWIPDQKTDRGVFIGRKIQCPVCHGEGHLISERKFDPAGENLRDQPNYPPEKNPGQERIFEILHGVSAGLAQSELPNLPEKKEIKHQPGYKETGNPNRKTNHKSPVFHSVLEENAMIKDYLAGMNTRVLCKIHNTSPGYLYSILPKHGILLNRLHGQKPLKFIPAGNDFPPHPIT
jgi:hypothetical protein